jgi:ATP-dependent exoDNAse (exonuclease V) beta subunit
VINAKEILISIDKLYNYIEKEFNPQKWHRELSLETEIDGQLYKGEVDLLLETTKGYILIDYKSYPGSIDTVLNAETSNYAGKYAGQLNIYKKMIENITNKQVINKLIYYTILGKLIEIE